MRKSELRYDMAEGIIKIKSTLLVKIPLYSKAFKIRVSLKWLIKNKQTYTSNGTETNLEKKLHIAKWSIYFRNVFGNF